MSDNPDVSQVELYASAIRKLLKGVVYHDDTAWSQIRDYEFAIRQYLKQIGLALHLDELGGFAHLHDSSRDEDSKDNLPAITSRLPLSFADTLLLTLLRERLDEHEMRDLDNLNLLLREDEMMEMLALFMGDHPDARKVEQYTQKSINRLKRYGFLTERRDGNYEVRSVLRSKIGADELSDIKTRLSQYVQKNGGTGNTDE